MTQRSGLIGYTGFVGSNLAASQPWTDLYNSKNFRDMTGQSFDLLVCAGVSAVKWMANREPEADWAQIQPLIDVLATVRARTFVLISTIDVYPTPLNVDENTPIAPEGGHPYGRHRLRLEQWTAQHFGQQGARLLTMRLPGCFGPGLKKNVLFDLLHDHQVDLIDPDGVFQYYDVRWLSRDLQVALDAGVSLVHLAVPPLRTGDIAAGVFGRTLAERPGPHGHYDFHTVHAGAWRQAGPYIHPAAEVMEAITSWVQDERRSIHTGQQGA